MSTHGGSSFPVPDTLFGRGHRVSRSPFLRSGRSSPRSFVPVPRPFVPVLRPFVPYSQIHHTLPSFGKRGLTYPGYNLHNNFFNTLVRGMPVLKTRNSLNLISTVRGGTKNPLKITNHAQGTVLGLPGASILPVLRAFRNPTKFLQVRWDASPNPHYYTRGTRLRVCPVVFGQPVFRSIQT